MASLRTPCLMRMSASLVRHTFVLFEKGTRALLYPSTNPHGYFSISSTLYRDKYALYDCLRQLVGHDFTHLVSFGCRLNDDRNGQRTYSNAWLRLTHESALRLLPIKQKRIFSPGNDTLM